MPSKSSSPGGPCDDSTTLRSFTVLLHRKNMTVAKARRRTTPITIPPTAAAGRPVWCGISAGSAVELDFEVPVALVEAVLDGVLEVAAVVPRKSAAAFGSLLNLIASRSTAAHPPFAQGLLLQHPMKGPGLVPVQV